ncbi:DNA gyrase subunit A [Moorella thermoacetica]|nr:DNA gyrase subunit A [Moorella thermoacetica]AKX92837.1 DNA gyrase subunit A [Moorella thermoacetica]AKX95390.1 DNA gyrase subunit A [Moorella thermoacetica]OIQ11323.1 DNA gyrase subunit A [Moorella thermoacetica]OIQ56845.1 DNA gyrase subunit A [Moorella thermoacetica]QCZ99199.1 DNA gyrase subunit A [Moorella thermoacetica]
MALETSGKIMPVILEEEMKRSYIDYAMSVIVGRALPDVRDGLKPVHRRILYAMYEEGLTPDKPYKKSAVVVGTVLARYHPHGDAAVYETMVRLAQDFACRYPLIDGHGNFGSVDGDSPAAMRYTEARLSKLALTMLADIDKDTVDFVDNYDGSLKEPVVLPARIPQLLVNGSAGIAVGMATNIPPHNLGEVIDALVLLIDKPDADLKEITKIIKGPDFPTAGLIIGREGIRNAYRTGRGSIKVRAKAQVETLSNGKSQIVVTEIPYQVNKARLVQSIGDLVREKKIDGIVDLRDESDRTGMRIVIELRRDVQPKVILNQLYKHTQMQENFGVIMLALVDGRPRVLNLREMLTLYLDHQKEVITRRTRYLLAQAEARAHIVAGLRIAIQFLDEVIRIIRQAPNEPEACRGLMERFQLSDKQAKAIVDMRLGRLTALEREKLEEEWQELQKRIAYYQEVLASEARVYAIVRDELLEIKRKFADPRRTQIVLEEENLELEDLIAREDIVVTLTHRGYIKRQPVDTYRSQKRGGRGIQAMGTREEDIVRDIFVTTTHHYLLFFTNQGRVFRLRGHEIPEAGRQARGTPLVNLLYLNKGETITAVIPIRELEEDSYLLMATRKGIVKKTSLGEYHTSRRDGLLAINLDEDDDLVGVLRTEGNNEVMLVTRRGKAIRFGEDEVRPMGRAARGVRGIALDDDDMVVGLVKVREDAELVVVSERGFGKRTTLEEYRPQGRGGKGIITMNVTDRTGPVAAVAVVKLEDELMLISAEGILIRLGVEDISRQGRNTQGVTLMRLEPSDRVVAMARIQ